MAMALMAWLTAPAPTHWIWTDFPSLIMPAIAPATEEGDDLLETLRCSMSRIAFWYVSGAFGSAYAA